MMSTSYNETSENEELEWKFQRTLIWIQYSRLHLRRPPPMNLIPNPRKIADCLSRLCEVCKNRLGTRISTESPKECINITSISNRKEKLSIDYCRYGSEENHAKTLRNVLLVELVERYKLKHHLLRKYE